MKSLLLSFILTCFITYSFMSLIDSNAQSWVSKLPNWSAFPIITLLGIAYLIALYWGVTGIMREQRVANGLGIFLSLCGIGLFWFGMMMEAGKSKAKEGQFDYVLAPQNLKDIEALQPILEQGNLKPEDIKMLAYWDLFKSQDTVAICMQKGRIIGINIKNIKINDISCLEKLPQLSSLTLNNCGLSEIKNLDLPKAERLNLNNNSLENLTGINAPMVKWLDVENNQLSSLGGIEKLPQAQYFNYSGNEITDYSAAKNHPFLNHLITKK